MSTVANITVLASEDIFRDKGKRLLRVPKGRRCGFRIYTNTKMAEIMDKITKVIWNVPMAALRFTFAGETVDPNDDFVSLHMRELDIIEVSHDLSYTELPPATLPMDLRKAFLARDGSDFIFKVGKRSPDTLESIDGDGLSYKEIPAHRWILRNRSERFCALFDSKMQESQAGSVEVPHYKPRIFELMLEYLYTDDVQGDISPEDSLQLLALADEYVIPRLKRKCELILMQDVKSSNAVELYVKADLHQADDLKTVCKQYFIENFFELKKQPTFLKEVSKVPELLIELTTSAIESLRSFKKQRTD